MSVEVSHLRDCDHVSTLTILLYVLSHIWRRFHQNAMIRPRLLVALNSKSEGADLYSILYHNVYFIVAIRVKIIPTAHPILVALFELFPR